MTHELKRKKKKNYSELNYKIRKIWEMRKVEVIEVVIGTLGKVTTHFDKWKPCLLGTEALFTWFGENNTESVGYEMRKKEATLPKTTSSCTLLSLSLPGNNIRHESKRSNDNKNNNLYGTILI